MIERFARPSPCLERALRVASVSHDGAFRKGTAIPYIEHPLTVALLLEQYGYRDELVVAGVLHDTVEDTKYESAEVQQRFSRLAGDGRLPAAAPAMVFRDAFLRYLEDEFGSQVFNLVLAVSERKNDGGVALDWLERKLRQLDRLAVASAEEAALKAADAVHNIETTVADIRRMGLGVLDRFRGGSLIVWHYSAIADLALQKMPMDAPLAARVRHAADQLSESVQSRRRPSNDPLRYPAPKVC
jgi:hypothetical protein